MNIGPRVADAVGAENYPAQEYQHERQPHEERLPERGEDTPLGHDAHILPILLREDERHEQKSMIRSPRHESEIRAVPQAAHQKNHECIAHDLGFRASAAAQRNVDIIPEPRGKRYMPFAPELGDVARKVRKIEIAHQIDTEQTRRAYRYIGIARKITVYLEREEDTSEQ